MIKCPMCREMLPDNARQCRKCQTDLTLLSDYTSHLRDGLSRAESSTRAGELGDAVWTYLAVLEIDPDNATARRQVGQVATAVRQFDRSMPGRRWLQRLQRQARFRHWVSSWSSDAGGMGWLGVVLLVLLVLGALVLGYAAGYQAGQPVPSTDEPAETATP